MYRVWYSTESFADYIIDHTNLSGLNPEKHKMYESDAGKPKNFHTMPDHIRKILYLDAPDLIVEKDNEPILSMEVTTEAGTGHNAFQRFSRIAAAAENGVPAFYIYPEGVIITRKRNPPKWDVINPLIFNALESVRSIYGIPALLYYFPTDIDRFGDCPGSAPNLVDKGLQYDSNIVQYPGCPLSSSDSMRRLFVGVNEVLSAVERYDVKKGLQSLLRNLKIREQIRWMQDECSRKAGGKPIEEMSPLSAVIKVKTEKVLEYLSRYERGKYRIGELLRNRSESIIYQINAKFRGDPYPGCLAAIDYLCCREGLTFEDRRYNLILAFGRVNIDPIDGGISIVDKKGSSINAFFKDVKSCAKKNLLTRDYKDLKCAEIPRYMMQVRYGSTYSKNKHIRVYSYFSDAIFFPDGSLWRDA